MLEDRNNTMIFLWEIYSIFMQISSIVLVLQHGRRAHTLYFVLVHSGLPDCSSICYCNVSINKKTFSGNNYDLSVIFCESVRYYFNTQLSHPGELEFELYGADKSRKVPNNTKVFLREKQILARVTLMASKRKTRGDCAFFGTK